MLSSITDLVRTIMRDTADAPNHTLLVPHLGDNLIRSLFRIHHFPLLYYYMVA